MGGDIPQVHLTIEPSDSQAAAIRGQADIPSAHRTLGQRDVGAAAGQLPEITPFPAAQVFFTGLRPVTVEQSASPTEIVQLERLLGEIHVRRVEIEAGSMSVLIGALPQYGFARLSLVRFLFVGLGDLALLGFLLLRRHGTLQSKRCQTQPHRQSHDHQDPRRIRDLVSPPGLLEPVCSARRPGDDGLIRQMTADIHRDAIGCLVAPRAILLQTLHDNPIQITAENRNQLGRLGGMTVCRGGPVLVRERSDLVGGSIRLSLADDLAHLIQTGFHQLLRVEWGGTGQ